MARTPGSYVPSGRVSAGLGLRDPATGIARASRGLITEVPEDLVDIALQDPAPLLSTVAIDSNGTPRLISNNIEALAFTDAGQQQFYNPDKEYTGYAADGFWYKDGQRSASDAALNGKPFQATWASESSSVDRGVVSKFPQRVLAVSTDLEIALIDADSLDVWMRFRVSRITVPGLGPLAGRSITIPNTVRLVDGYLLLATNDGLRIADFRQDRGIYLGAVSWTSVTGLEDRNTTTYLDGVSTSNPTRTLLSDECLSLDARSWAGWKSEQSAPSPSTSRQLLALAVVGQPGGLCSVSLNIPGYARPRVYKHEVSRTITAAWSAEDDGDLDSSSPLFQDSGTNWLGLRVQAGDILTPDTASERTILEVQQVVPGNRLVVSPEILLTDSGASYDVTRNIESVYLSPEFDLYFANGTGSIAVNRTKDWFETENFTSPVPLFNDLIVRGSVAKLAARVDSINDMDKLAGRLYVATSLGIFSVSDSDLNQERGVAFLYSTSAVTEAEAEYKILEGTDKSAVAVAVDPETGNVSVAVTGASSVVTEINPTIQQAFRFYDNVGRVMSLVAYRNPSGPPDEVP